jgi:hypothetical protein
MLPRRRAAVDAFNKENRWKKRGLSVTPVKFGMSFTAKFMNQVLLSLPPTPAIAPARCKREHTKKRVASESVRFCPLDASEKVS